MRRSPTAAGPRRRQAAGGRRDAKTCRPGAIFAIVPAGGQTPIGGLVDSRHAAEEVRVREAREQAAREAEAHRIAQAEKEKQKAQQQQPKEDKVAEFKRKQAEEKERQAQELAAKFGSGQM